jgi:hypothetical protein
MPFHSIGAPANNAADLDPAAIPETHLGQVLSAGLLLRYLDRLGHRRWRSAAERTAAARVS